VIAGTTLRNQGASGVVDAARDYLFDLDLRKFADLPDDRFAHRLDSYTEELRVSLPTRARHFGTARKSINLFLMEAFYNRVLCEAYNLQSVEDFLELPIDGHVADGLKKQAKIYGVSCTLPKWHGIKNLKSDTNVTFQNCAKEIAGKMHVARVYLDLLLWRSPDTSERID